MLWCVSPSYLDEVGYFDDGWKDSFNKSFDRFGQMRRANEVQKTIQRDWVDLFRLNS